MNEIIKELLVAEKAKNGNKKKTINKNKSIDEKFKMKLQLLNKRELPQAYRT